MGDAGPASATWIPEDDLLLKKAVEDGASLQALAKGAVRFSRRYSYKELQDRWHSLLYDPDVSAQASDLMFKLELSGFSSSLKSSRSENFRGHKEIPQKRKHGNIRKQYRAMRKKFQSELFSSSDLRFFDRPSLHDCHGHGADFRENERFNREPQDGSFLPENLVLQEADLDILRNVFPETIQDYDVSSALGGTNNTYPVECANPIDANYPNKILRKYELPSDVSCSLRQDDRGLSVADAKCLEVSHTFNENMPNFGECTAIKEFSSVQMPPGKRLFKSSEKKYLSSFDSADDTPQNVSCGYGGAHHFDSPNSEDGDFTDLPDSLLNLSNEDGMAFMDVDGKDAPDMTSFDGLSSAPQSSPKVVQEEHTTKVEPETLMVEETCISAPNTVDTIKMEVNSSSHHIDQQIFCHLEDNIPSISGISAESRELDSGNICCTLNTEDTEIPCNDDIFLLIHPSTVLASSASQPFTRDSLDEAANVRVSEQGPRLLIERKDSSLSFPWPQNVGASSLPETNPAHLVLGCVTKSELADANPFSQLPGGADKAPGDLCHNRSSHGTSKCGDELGSLLEMPQYAEADLKVDIPEPATNSSVSHPEEPQSDDDVPDFSDIEAMILEMELDPPEEDTSISRQGSRYQREETRTIIRLEQCARSLLQRTMTSQGAFAIFYGRHLKHYIRKTEVILGRSTDDIDVDIDLRKEGRANKISRRQAIIKMEADGSFSLKNIGKGAVYVNGKSVTSGQSVILSSSCLIEIKEMSFVFEINQKYVRLYLDVIARKSIEKNGKFNWSPEGVA